MSPLYYVFRTYNIDMDYLGYYFETNYWHHFMKLNGDSGARSDRFSIKDIIFKTMPIPYPVINEQREIANLLKQIDQTITLHQRESKLNFEEVVKCLFHMIVMNFSIVIISVG